MEVGIIIMKQAFRNKLRQTLGVSIGEVLAAVLIITLVSQGLAAGVAVAYRQFRSSMKYSDAQILYSTLETVISNELRFSDPFADPELLVALDPDDQITEYGELAFWKEGTYVRILDHAGYPDGLQAKAELQYDENRKHFTVFLSIRKDDDILIDGNGFPVLLLNDWKTGIE